MSNISFLLTCLTIPLFIELFDLQSKLSLSSTGHTILEVLIVLGIFWLIVLIDRFDRWLYLHNFSSEKKNLRQHDRMEEISIFTMEASITPDSTDHQKKTEQIEKPVLDPPSRFDVPENRGIIRKLTQKIGQ